MLTKDKIFINPEIRIETTTCCQANCEICPHDKMTRGQETMAYQRFNYIVSKLLKHNKLAKKMKLIRVI